MMDSIDSSNDSIGVYVYPPHKHVSVQFLINQTIDMPTSNPFYRNLFVLPSKMLEETHKSYGEIWLVGIGDEVEAPGRDVLSLEDTVVIRHYKTLPLFYRAFLSSVVFKPKTIE